MSADQTRTLGRSYRGVGAAERDEQRRLRLLDAALEIFGTVGYPRATVDGICTAAGVSTRNFYDHFASREAILIAVYDRIVEGAQFKLGEALAGRRPGEPLAVLVRATLEAFTDFMLEDPRRARVNFVEVVGASPTVEAHRRTVLRSFARLIAQAAQPLTDAGLMVERPGSEIRVGTAMIIGGVQETLTDWLSDPPEARTPLATILDALASAITAVIGSVVAAQSAPD